MRKPRLRNLSLDIELTVVGNLLNVHLIPFRWSRMAFRGHRDLAAFNRPRPCDFHLFAGPLHIWTGGGFSDLLALKLSVSQNPFHGTAIMPKRPRMQEKTVG